VWGIERREWDDARRAASQDRHQTEASPARTRTLYKCPLKNGPKSGPQFRLKTEIFQKNFRLLAALVSQNATGFFPNPNWDLGLVDLCVVED